MNPPSSPWDTEQRRLVGCRAAPWHGNAAESPQRLQHLKGSGRSLGSAASTLAPQWGSAGHVVSAGVPQEHADTLGMCSFQSVALTLSAGAKLTSGQALA